jgi:phospho-N-acetylmuramoyl-pentapeptide-transferase
MGGTLILFSLLLSTLLLADLTNPYVWLVIAVTVGFAAIGFADDYQKLAGAAGRGLTVRGKLAAQAAVGLAVSLVLYGATDLDTQLYVPFLKDVHPDLGWWYVPFATLIIIAASNAVNLTDGLDGLAIGPVMTTAFAFGIFAYVTGNSKWAAYLHLPYVVGAGELSIFCGALVCAGLGFLWFNAYPAMMFMGDVGSLPLGAALAVVALVTKQELVLVIAGGVFVAEALSVIFQVVSFKLRRKRVFLMAPIHHHFELLGWPEPQIIVRFWIVSVICAMLALSALKLR